MVVYLITFGILFVSLLCMTVMVIKLFQQYEEPVSIMMCLKLIFSGVIAFVADTLGIGSFAVNVALARLLGTFKDYEMPAVNNGAQVIPGTIEALFFMQLVDVDLVTLLTLVAGTCAGGLLGAYYLSRCSIQALRLSMLGCFALIILLLLAHQYHVLTLGGDLVALHSWMLVVGFFAMLICGALTSASVGLFVMVQAVLFVMNISPVVAFPIMTIAGAMQQPLTSLVFVQKNMIPLQKTLILSLAGCLGVLITMPLFTQLAITWLHLVLLGLLIFNFCSVGYTYLRVKVNSYAEKSLCTIAG